MTKLSMTDTFEARFSSLSLFDKTFMKSISLDLEELIKKLTESNQCRYTR